jgi:uncharacterized damage-inducible protein DinB
MINGLQRKRGNARTFLQTKGGRTMTTMTEPIATMIQPMLAEFREETAITKRILERVPADKLAWKPHRKSMSLGQLALHIASVPGSVARISQLDEFDVAEANFDPPAPKNVEEIRAAFQQSVRAAEACLSGISEEEAMGNWRLLANGLQIFNRPRVEVLRSVMLNHWYHHRGQLSVYLRMLDVAVPVIYGPSADENPFG